MKNPNQLYRTRWKNKYINIFVQDKQVSYTKSFLPCGSTLVENLPWLKEFSYIYELVNLSEVIIVTESIVPQKNYKSIPKTTTRCISHTLLHRRHLQSAIITIITTTVIQGFTMIEYWIFFWKFLYLQDGQKQIATNYIILNKI